jgi:all-trans-retinol 13,14-reductase
MPDAAIIGAGFSGLATAILLARDGWKVTVLEQASRPAPLLRNYDCGGFETNNGFHYIGGYYPDGALDRAFAYLGLKDRLAPVALNADGYDSFVGILERPIHMPVGSARVRDVLNDTFPGNEAALEAYFRELEAAFRDFDFFGLEEYFFRADPMLVTGSLEKFLAGRGATPGLTLFLDTYSEMLLGVPAREVPFLTHLLGVGAYFLSAHTFTEGGGSLAAALEAQAAEAGVCIRTGCRVVGIESGGHRRFSAVRFQASNGAEESLSADICVSTIHPKRLPPLLPDGLSSGLFARRVAGYRDSKSVCLFHMAVEADLAARFTGYWHSFYWNEARKLRHGVTLLPDLTKMPVPGASEVRMSALISAWDNDKSESCPGSSDPACREIYLGDGAGPGRPAPAALDLLRDRFQARLEAAFPEMRGAYRILAVTAPCDFDRMTGTWNGSIYGLKCSPDRLGMTPMGPLKGLYLAGQSVIAPGIYGSLVSAFLVRHRARRRRME